MSHGCLFKYQKFSWSGHLYPSRLLFPRILHTCRGTTPRNCTNQQSREAAECQANELNMCQSWVCSCDAHATHVSAAPHFCKIAGNVHEIALKLILSRYAAPSFLRSRGHDLTWLLHARSSDFDYIVVCYPIIHVSSAFI